MLNIGDTVRPKRDYIGHKYIFKILDKFITVDDYGKLISTYKLQRINQKLDPINGPVHEQETKIACVESHTWKEHELELITPHIPKISSGGIPLAVKNDGLILSGPQPDKPQEIKLKEENMKILDIYKERKENAILEDYNNQRDKILEEDEMQKIIREMELQINTILDIEERLDRVDFSSGNEELLTNVSKEKLEKLEAETDKERDKLHDNIEEIKALFELTEDYEERMKILKKYDIINKDGKLTV